MTADATLRVFLPHIDAPQHLVLHAALDHHSVTALSDLSSPSAIFWLDRNYIDASLERAISMLPNGIEDGRHRRIREIKEEGWDLFLRVLGDGSLIVQAVAVRSLP